MSFQSLWIPASLERNQPLVCNFQKPNNNNNQLPILLCSTALLLCSTFLLIKLVQWQDWWWWTFMTTFNIRMDMYICLKLPKVQFFALQYTWALWAKCVLTKGSPLRPNDTVPNTLLRNSKTLTVNDSCFFLSLFFFFSSSVGRLIVSPGKRKKKKKEKEKNGGKAKEERRRGVIERRR